MAAGEVSETGGYERAAGAAPEDPPCSFAGLFAPWLQYLASGRPSLLLEQRAGLELAELYCSPVYHGAGVPWRNGAPVLLIPGFLGSDSYLTVLRGWLRRVGYEPHLS